MFNFRPEFWKFFSLIEKWKPLTRFSITTLLSIYNYIFKKWVNRYNSEHFYFYDGFMLVLPSPNGDLSN